MADLPFEAPNLKDDPHKLFAKLEAFGFGRQQLGINSSFQPFSVDVVRPEPDTNRCVVIGCTRILLD